VSAAVWFYLVLFFLALAALCGWRGPDAYRWQAWSVVGFLFFLALLLLGWRVFGPPIQ
jgi:hypothetical protein